MNEDFEFGFWRESAPTPYVGTGTSLVIGLESIRSVHEAFGPYADRRLEGCCFLYGIRESATIERVLAVVVPPQINRRDSFDVPGDAIAAMSAATRPNRWLNLAQIHTHPGEDVEHSGYDDGHVNSRRALSLVLPWYGVGSTWPDAVGVHEFQNDYWHLLSAPEARDRIHVLDDAPHQLLDLR